MSFGLKSAPATFQQMMDHALKGIIEKLFVYLDNIVVFGSTIEEHEENSRVLPDQVRETGLRLQPDKCEYLRLELEYLGYLITADGVEHNPVKILAVKDFKIPKCLRDVQSFLGLAAYCREFIKNFLLKKQT